MRRDRLSGPKNDMYGKWLIRNVQRVLGRDAVDELGRISSPPPGLYHITPVEFRGLIFDRLHLCYESVHL